MRQIVKDICLGSVFELTAKGVGNGNGTGQGQRDADIEQLRSKTVRHNAQRRSDDGNDGAKKTITKRIGLSIVGIIQGPGSPLKRQPHITQVDNGDDDPDQDSYQGGKGNKKVRHVSFFLRFLRASAKLVSRQPLRGRGDSGVLNLAKSREVEVKIVQKTDNDRDDRADGQN
jgi:hypothetical protein